MAKLNKREKKDLYFQKLKELLKTYPNILLVDGDNVGSKQFADIRAALRGKAIMLFGKNTMIRTCIRQMIEEDAANAHFEGLLDYIRLNTGFLFCIDDATEVRKVVAQFKRPSAAKQGAIAPVDVHIPAGNTGLEPAQTAFFQTLGINTKITKGSIEIMANVHLIKEGNRVSASQAALLAKLSIRPFEYGLGIKYLWTAEGEMLPASVLEITNEYLQERFLAGIANVAAVSLAANMVNAASIPHIVVDGFKNCCALAMSTDIQFPQLAALLAAASSAPAAAAGAAPAAAAAAAPEEEEEEEVMEFDLF